MNTKDHGQLNSHLHELRRRVLVCFITIIVCSSTSYLFRTQLAEFFVAPLFDAYPKLATLIYTNLTEALFSYLKMAILVGIMASFPIICFQAWMYIAPGLHQTEKRAVFLVVFCASLLFGGGAAFAYFIVLPHLLSFFMSFASEALQPKPKFGAYLTFVARNCLAFGLAFQIPFLMVASGRLGWVKRSYFTSKRTYFYLAILVLSFLLTAGDILSAIMLAAPLFLLYEAGILVMRVFVK